LINPRIFSKMLLGYRSLDEIEPEHLDVRIKPEYRELVASFFRRQRHTFTPVIRQPKIHLPIQEHWMHNHIDEKKTYTYAQIKKATYSN
jgi:hypothetical protein